MNGSYDSIKSTVDTLSCILLKKTSAEEYTLAQFISDLETPTFKILDTAAATLPFAAGTDENSDVTVGENCQKISIAGSIYQLSSDETSYAQLSVPQSTGGSRLLATGSATVTAASEDLSFVMSGRHLYYHPSQDSSSYVHLHSYDSAFIDFQVKSYWSDVLVVGVKLPGGNSREQHFWVSTENSGSLISVGTFNVTGETSSVDSILPYIYSIDLSVVAISFMETLGSDYTSRFESFDFYHQEASAI